MTFDAVAQADAIRVELDPRVALASYARHRRRFASAVANLGPDALATPSRCSRWSVADVLRHCVDVDGWMEQLWSGRPPPFSSFDPNTTPHEFVLAGRTTSDGEARDRYVASAEAMAADVEGSSQERWGVPSISPLGVVPWWLSALHVFYDSWLHERDVLLPLGADVPVLPDESTAILAYSLALTGTFIGEETDVVIAGVRVVAGGGEAVRVSPTGADPGADVGSVIDALSGRGAALEVALPETEAEVVQRLGGLARFLLSGETG